MELFLKKIALFVLPIILFGLAIATIDPYHLFSSKVFDNEQKKNIAYRLNYALWKYIEYDKNPNPTILLGDSRMALLSDSIVKRLTGKSVYNFSYGGGTMPEIIQTFWYANEKADLKEVCIGINFELYNGREKKNRCVEAENILENKGMYFINQSVINSSFFMLQNALTGKEKVIGKPKNRDKFWKNQLKTAANVVYKDYTYPAEFYKDLQKIVNHCNEHNIKLSFVILPTHIDLQNQIIASNREKEFNRFRADIYSLGKVYDFHKESSLTTKKELYKDPFHFGGEVRTEVVKYIFGLQPANAEVLTISK